MFLGNISFTKRKILILKIYIQNRKYLLSNNIVVLYLFEFYNIYDFRKISIQHLTK